MQRGGACSCSRAVAMDALERGQQTDNWVNPHAALQSRRVLQGQRCFLSRTSNCPTFQMPQSGPVMQLPKLLTIEMYLRAVTSEMCNGSCWVKAQPHRRGAPRGERLAVPLEHTVCSGRCRQGWSHRADEGRTRVSKRHLTKS